ncbi:MAG TPA: hypothetical protein VFZ34_18385 [Blastocatellia bacterium]|nr:hypothetical protein [Blastocatellia bacterium]
MNYRTILLPAVWRRLCCLCVLVFFPLIVGAQTAPLRVSLNVSQASLPVTIGVPVSEAAELRSTARLTLLDPNGNAVALQARVLARWRGAATDESKPLKWVLLDFTPKVAGNYTLTNAGTAAPQNTPIVVTQTSDKISVTSTQVQMDFARKGAALVPSFKLDSAEQLTAPFTVQGLFPRSAIVVLNPTSSDTLTVNETSLLTPGTAVRFEHCATLKWPVEKTWTSVWSADIQLRGNHRYLLDEGTPQQEEILCTEADYGTLKLAAPLKYSHPAGAKLRDLTVEQEVATIKSIAGQRITFTEPLKQNHVTNDCLRAESIAPATALATVETAVVEEANALRVVIKQQGRFVVPNSTTIAAPTLGFTLRYYIYADQPFVRVRLRLLNEGTYGFGAVRLQQGPYTQHVLLRGLSALVPTIAAGNGQVRVTEAAAAYAKVAARQNAAQISAGTFEVAVPEFAENFPKALHADAKGLRFDVLPDLGSDYQFDGARAKTTDVYLGRNTTTATALTNSLRVSLDPAYVARTGAVRPLLVEKRDWSKQFSTDSEMAEAAARAERHLAVSYAVENSDSNARNPAQSIYEYRLRNEMGANLGWRNFGDLAWAAGYANVHYDLPFILLREFLRTGDARAFQAGSEMARYRADWGHYHANDYWDREGAYNMRGVAFYEKGDHGSDVLPMLTHNWIEGLWLHWALTGDETVGEAAREGSEALARFLKYEFTADNALKWNEPRWLGWPALGLMTAWRYTGEARYLESARKSVYLLMNAEEKAGKKGWFIPETSGIGPITQPFMWAGYCQLGIIEYWRETNDNRVAEFIVRVADWLLGNTGSQAVLQGGRKLSSGSYQPLGAELYWSPTRQLEPGSNELAMINLPVLTAAARITNRADLRATARQLFRDVAFYRDINPGQAIDTSFRALINFRAFQFGGNAPKVYGQTGLTLSEYLPDLVGAIVTPRRTNTAANALLEEATTRTVQAGQTLRVVVRKADAEGKTLTLSAATLPANARFDAAAGEFVFSPTVAQAGNVFQVAFSGVNATTQWQSRLDVIVLADNQLPQVRLLSPSNNQRLTLGKMTNIAWTTDAPQLVAKYEVRLSTDGGVSYPTVLAQLPGTATAFAWKVPETLSHQRRAAVRLMVVAVDAQNRASLDVTPEDLQLAGQLAVVSAGHYLPTVTPGSLCSAFGTKLATTQTSLEPSPSLYQRSGTTVEILDSLGRLHRIPLFFAASVADGSYDQVNFYMPEEIALGEAVCTITASTGEVSQGVITIQSFAPALFTKQQNGQGEAAVVGTDDGVNFTVGYAQQDATRDVYVSLFGTGWRFANASQGGKSLEFVSEIAVPRNTVTVEVNRQPVEVLYAGAQPEYLGLDQINIKLPRELLPGLYPMVIKIGDQMSNEVLLRVK